MDILLMFNYCKIRNRLLEVKFVLWGQRSIKFNMMSHTLSPLYLIILYQVLQGKTNDKDKHQCKCLQLSYLT